MDRLLKIFVLSFRHQLTGMRPGIPPQTPYPPHLNESLIAHAHILCNGMETPVLLLAEYSLVT